MMERLARRLRLPTWAAVLLVVVVVDTAVVFAVWRVARPSVPKVWREQDLQSKYMLQPMDRIHRDFGPPDFSSVDSYGNLACLRYYRLGVTADGRPKDLYFFGVGGRCTDCGTDGPR